MNTDKLFVSEINIFPVKSCAGITVNEAKFDNYGIAYDRNWMVVDAETGMFMSQRSDKKMCLIDTDLSFGPLILRAPQMEKYELSIKADFGFSTARIVTVWESECLAIDQGDEVAKWLSTFLEKRCRLVRIPIGHGRSTKKGDALVGFADAYTALVVSQASLDDLNSKLGEPVPMNRFRPNIVISGSLPYAEDYWKRLRIGKLELDGITPCARCSIVCTDQRTGKRSVEPNATLAKYRMGKHIGRTDGDHSNEIYFGRNFNHRNFETIRVGDIVEVLN